jgi:hypothetical protein
MGIPIIFNNKEIGRVYGKIYESHRDTKKHFYVKGRGYPITNDVLKKLKEMEVDTVRIVENGVKGIKTYICPLKKYMDAVMIQEGDYEPQRCVPLVEMQLVSFQPPLDSKQNLNNFMRDTK